MKTSQFTTVCALLLIAATVFAQAPESIQYQAIVRDANGDAIANSNISMQITIRQDSANGFNAYRETHSVTTNDFGLANLAIGTGTFIGAPFSSIDWPNGPFFMNVALDPAGGTSFTDMGTSELLSVPYALYAGAAEDVDDADADPANELQQLSMAGRDISLSQGGGTVTLAPGVKGYTNNTAI